MESKQSIHFLERRKRIVKNAFEKNGLLTEDFPSNVFTDKAQTIIPLAYGELAQLLREKTSQSIPDFYSDLITHPEKYTDQYVQAVLDVFKYSPEAINTLLQIIRQSISIQTKYHLEMQNPTAKTPQQLLEYATATRSKEIVEFTFFSRARIHSVAELAYILDVCADPQEYEDTPQNLQILQHKLILLDEGNFFEHRINYIQDSLRQRARREKIYKIAKRIDSVELQHYYTYALDQAEELNVFQSSK